VDIYSEWLDRCEEEKLKSLEDATFGGHEDDELDDDDE